MINSFKQGRTLVGELLVSLVVDDMGTASHTIIIEGDAVTADRAVKINAPEVGDRHTLPIE